MVRELHQVINVDIRKCRHRAKLLARKHSDLRLGAALDAGDHADRYHWAPKSIMDSQLKRHLTKCRNRTLKLRRLDVSCADLVSYRWGCANVGFSEPFNKRPFLEHTQTASIDAATNPVQNPTSC